MTGYRTYISAALITIHQILKLAGYDIPYESLSIAFDTVMSIAAILFRWLANK